MARQPSTPGVPELGERIRFYMGFTLPAVYREWAERHIQSPRFFVTYALGNLATLVVTFAVVSVLSTRGTMEILRVFGIMAIGFSAGSLTSVWWHRKAALRRNRRRWEAETGRAA